MVRYLVKHRDDFTFPLSHVLNIFKLFITYNYINATNKTKNRIMHSLLL
jgi:hypothetical protein